MNEKWTKRITLFLMWPVVAPALVLMISCLLIACWPAILLGYAETDDADKKDS